MNIAFRVDASKEVGIGHLMRCLALTEELTKRGNKCYILSKYDNQILLDKIKKFRVEIIKLDFKDDVRNLIDFSRKKGIDWIITDCYSLNSEYIKKLKKENFRVLSIDDNSLIHYYSDIVLNQNIGSEKLRFSAEDYTKFLLGTKYVILQDELLRREEKNYRKKVYNILVALGGTDRYNLTLKILKALDETNQESEVFVVMGPFNPFYEDLKKFVEKSDLKINLLKSPEKMAEIYLKSDIAISAGGTSCYEIAYFGIPNLIVTIADNQLKNAEELDRQKVSINLGHKNKVFNKLITDKVNQLITNDSLMKLMSKNGMKLVDGEGKKRIVKFVESYA